MERLQAAVLLIVFVPATSFALDVVPGLKGFGTDTRAAYGGSGDPVICVVDTLADNSMTLTADQRNGVPVVTGTLRACLESNDGAVFSADQGRVILFEVGGTLESGGDHLLFGFHPYVTVAGQTAPPPGITLKNIALAPANHDQLVQHIRVRVGDSPVGEDPWHRTSVKLSTYTPDTRDVYNVVLDHLSTSWAPDTNGPDLSSWDSSTVSDCTVSHCIISEGLHRSLHEKGPHGKGMDISGSTRMAVIGNLFAHNGDRNPYISPRYDTQHAAVINNLIWNPGDRAIHYQSSVAAQVVIENNMIVAGVRTYWRLGETVAWLTSVGAGAQLYIAGNSVKDDSGTVRTQSGSTDWSLVHWGIPEDLTVRVTTPPFYPDGYVPFPAAEVPARVLPHVGARAAERGEIDGDPVDTRVVESARLENDDDHIDCVGPDDIYFPTGVVLGGTANTVQIQMQGTEWGGQDTETLGGWVLKRVEITSGQAAGQGPMSCTGYTFDGNDGGQNRGTLEISGTWDPVPAAGDGYRVITDCTRNGGGWPTGSAGPITLVLPTDPHGDADSDGYTNLEEWLHARAAEVEGRSESTTVFSAIDYFGDRLNYEELNVSRWSVASDGDDLRYGLVTSDYDALSGGRLGEYALVSERTYDDFELSLIARSAEDFAANGGADLCLVFGHRDASNYHYMMLNAVPSNNELFRVAAGTREGLGAAGNTLISEGTYHELVLRRVGGSVRLTVDGVERLAVDDLTIEPGAVGVGSFNDAAFFDDIEVTPLTTADGGPSEEDGEPTPDGRATEDDGASTADGLVPDGGPHAGDPPVAGATGGCSCRGLEHSSLALCLAALLFGLRLRREVRVRSRRRTNP